MSFSSRWATHARIRTILPVAGAIAVLAGSVTATAGGGMPASEQTLKHAAQASSGQDDVTTQATQFVDARLAPGASLDPAAYPAAFAAAATLPLAGSNWKQVTSQPYDSDAQNYRDPVFSNSGGGSGLVSGRMTALAVDGVTVYAGGADGGVWKSTDQGTTWTPMFDKMTTTSIGSIAIDPADHSVWVGTGEANTNSDSYRGIGVVRSIDGGVNWTQVGGSSLSGMLIGRLAFDGAGGVYAATNRGLFKRASADLASDWTLVDKPGTGPYGMTFVNDVAVQPGTNGKVVVANAGWRGGASYNGFYVSRDGGASFAYVNPGGAINANDIGRSTFAYSADGSKLYSVVESVTMYNKPNIQTGNTVLDGVFVSNTGDPAGPWNQIADYRKLANSGSALRLSKGYAPGVQAWYNQFLAVDPVDSNHIYVGLEEVFETTDGGSNWTTVGPYWNFPFDCWQANPDSCPKTTHPDQHAIAIANGTVFVGNDGGVYRRNIQNHQLGGWTDLNATLHTLQYYYAGVGRMAAGGDAFWGGLQDNGESLLLPSSSTMVSPFGGDGGDTLVDPNNGNRAVVEYVGLDMARTQNGGQSNGTTAAFTEITPACSASTYRPNPCDPNPRFIAPFRADLSNINHWVAGGQYVWDNQGKGWDTSCSATACDWKVLHDTGAGHQITSLAVLGTTIYAAWCGPCNKSGFASGVDANTGGTWHTVSSAVLPNRFVAGLTVDPANASHVYAVYNGFSRRWIPYAGNGNVFESMDGGTTWANISGNLPDAPADRVVISHGQLVLATDIGVFTAAAGQGPATSWSRFGTGLPNAVANDISLSPDGSYLIVATHGRGIWTIAAPVTPKH